jgi:hypothetical protein
MVHVALPFHRSPTALPSGLRLGKLTDPKKLGDFSKERTMRKRYVAVSLSLVVALLLLGVTAALADPTMPFSGSASAVAIETDLQLDVTAVTVEVGILVGSEYAGITGASGDVDTGGDGDGVIVSETSPLIDADIEVVHTEAAASTTSTDVDTDTDFVLSFDSLLVDTALISSTTRAESLATRQTLGQGTVDDLSIFGNPLGIDAFVEAETVTESAHVISTAAGTSVGEEAEARIEGAAVNLFTVTGVETIVSADVMTATATSMCDSATGNPNTADANYGFVNLMVNGVPVVIQDPGTQVTATIGTTDVAVVTIAPVYVTSIGPDSASAAATALRVEIIADVGAVEAGTVIDFAATETDCMTAAPTNVSLSSLSGAGRSSLPYVLLPGFALGLATLFGVGLILRKRPSMFEQE